MNQRIKVFDSVRKYKWYFVVGPLLKAFETVVDLIVPLIMKNILDYMVQGHSQDECLYYLFTRLALIISLCLLGFTFTMICQYIASVAAQKVSNDVRIKLFNHITRFSVKDVESFPDGYLNTCLTTDTTYVQTGVLHFIRLVSRAPFLIIGALIITFTFDWSIGLLFLATIPIICFIVFFVMRKSSKQYTILQKELDELTSLTSDTITGNRVIRAFNREDYQKEMFQKESEYYAKLGRKVSFINAFINPLVYMVINVAIVLVVYISGMKIDGVITTPGGNKLEATTVIALVNYLEQIFIALIVITNLVNIFTRAGISSRRINKIFAKKASIANDGKKIVKEIEKGEPLYQFENVTFAYEDEGNKTLTDINFTVNKGEKVGVIGGTGCGKSTLAKCLLRMVDATEGTVKYKGEKISDYDLPTLHNEVGMVYQKSVLFKGTIKSNILMANKTLTDDEIIKALKDALAFEFVSNYSDTINHEVEEGGRNFSGGQKQRISIARILAKNPEVMIFDDSTSALDYLSDLTVRKNIETKYSDKTIFYISQRVSTIRNCDKIIVMDHGQVVGVGTHAALLNSNLVYQEIYRSQTKEAN